MTYQNLLAETKDGVALITLNRPKALNALCDALMDELTCVLDAAEKDDAVRVIVLTGSEKAFAAGADIKEIKDKDFSACYREDFVTRNWERAARCRKPVIAAVSGFCLGGGLELAMMCDFIIADETAKFGQPEITIGTIPGGGGTQRLARLVGPARAMELCLTGRIIDAAEAGRIGLAARVVPAGKLMEDALATAKTIAGHSRLAAMMAKEAVKAAAETSLSQGLHFERRLFHASFSTADQKEGMTAFTEKRKPEFRDE